MSTTKYPVMIVGAGPGAPDLITLRGQVCLQTADVVFYTGSLVPEEMLSWCQPHATLIDTRSHVLETLLEDIMSYVRKGRRVVRLQDGDPCLYGALFELSQGLLAADVEFEVVPGVSAFQAAAAALQSELTIPHLVQTIILTRASGRVAVPKAEELSSLAAHQASLCLYLSARHCDAARTQLLEHYPATTPVAMCYRIGWPDQEIRLGSLDMMHELSEGLDRTVLYLISPALAPDKSARSQLYSAKHGHLFRPKS